MSRDPFASDPLARSVTHELREALTVVRGYAGLLRTHGLTAADRAAFIERIDAAATRMVGALDRLERGDVAACARLGPNGEYELLDLRA